ncbi:hypothetical protein CPB85DRAFT_1278121 [Mucidula mucida]|nr:hypothetical protein CPB85DRAFT_1278121 [Mucidula mucida]
MIGTVFLVVEVTLLNGIEDEEASVVDPTEVTETLTDEGNTEEDKVGDADDSEDTEAVDVARPEDDGKKEEDSAALSGADKTLDGSDGSCAKMNGRQASHPNSRTDMMMVKERERRMIPRFKSQAF